MFVIKMTKGPAEIGAGSTHYVTDRPNGRTHLYGSRWGIPAKTWKTRGGVERALAKLEAWLTERNRTGGSSGRVHEIVELP